MPSLLEHYGFISDMSGSALVSRDGSVDWLCIPRFDSAAAMAALLGRDDHGCWRMHPGAAVRRVQRRYRPGTLILETDFECDGGAVRFIDFMPFGPETHSLVRVVEGLGGTVPVDFVLIARFGFGAYVPWVVPSDGGVAMTAAPDTLLLRTKAQLQPDDDAVRGLFSVSKGERVAFELSWHQSSRQPPPPLDVEAELRDTEQKWKEWSGRSKYRGPYADVVNRTLTVLKGMIYAPSGGIVAAPTAGLPEEIGGVRNWDYRFCWLRDATLTLDALMLGGYVEEATAWRQWLLNAAAGAPEQVQIMYGIEGERRLTEFEATWLPGYEESRPVRIGNAASEQFQLDVYGEVIQALYEARRLGVPEAHQARGTAARLMAFLETAWQRPDDGIWEVRGGRRHFVHSKMMAWVAVDRMARIIDEFTPRDDPWRANLPRLRSLRDRIHRDVCERGFDAQQNAFTQSYNSPALDAGVLLMPALGFLPATDPRVLGTIQAIEKTLVRDGFVLRYDTEHAKDGLPGSEGAFLACSFWLVDAYAYTGRRKDAEALFERLVRLQNDLGLLSEEYEPRTGRLIGNFPQAFSHLALVHSASVLAGAEVTPRASANGQKQAPAPSPAQ
ncbi:MAG TPA: glycoside hydrolase family 15 protein [Polyangiaceae bacterium]|nr:glycoside hydrolase family 15 protein [Polyangiaceae bacterium]